MLGTLEARRAWSLDPSINPVFQNVEPLTQPTPTYTRLRHHGRLVNSGGCRGSSHMNESG